VWSRGSGSLHHCNRRTVLHGHSGPSFGRNEMMQAQLAQRRSPLLAVRDVSVVFGGVIALNGVSFDMQQGQILGLIGPNGAGKTTLFNCLSRLYQPSISLFLGMVVGGVGWLPGSIVGSAFIIFVPNIAEGISKGLSGAVLGVLLFPVIFLVPHGARQVAHYFESIYD